MRLESIHVIASTDRVNTQISVTNQQFCWTTVEFWTASICQISLKILNKGNHVFTLNYGKLVN